MVSFITPYYGTKLSKRFFESIYESLKRDYQHDLGKFESPLIKEVQKFFRRKANREVILNYEQSRWQDDLKYKNEVEPSLNYIFQSIKSAEKMDDLINLASDFFGKSSNMLPKHESSNLLVEMQEIFKNEDNRKVIFDTERAKCKDELKYKKEVEPALNHLFNSIEKAKNVEDLTKLACEFFRNYPKMSQLESSNGIVSTGFSQIVPSLRKGLDNTLPASSGRAVTILKSSALVHATYTILKNLPYSFFASTVGVDDFPHMLSSRVSFLEGTLISLASTVYNLFFVVIYSALVLATLGLSQTLINDCSEHWMNSYYGLLFTGAGMASVVTPHYGTWLSLILFYYLGLSLKTDYESDIFHFERPLVDGVQGFFGNKSNRELILNYEKDRWHKDNVKYKEEVEPSLNEIFKRIKEAGEEEGRRANLDDLINIAYEFFRKYPNMVPKRENPRHNMVVEVQKIFKKEPNRKVILKTEREKCKDVLQYKNEVKPSLNHLFKNIQKAEKVDDLIDLAYEFFHQQPKIGPLKSSNV